jgi:hypothetical protein
MSDPLFRQIGRCAVLTEHRDAPRPERMQPSFWNPKRRQQRIEDPIADVDIRQRSAVAGFKHPHAIAYQFARVV